MPVMNPVSPLVVDTNILQTATSCVGLYLDLVVFVVSKRIQHPRYKIVQAICKTIRTKRTPVKQNVFVQTRDIAYKCRRKTNKKLIPKN